MNSQRNSRDSRSISYFYNDDDALEAIELSRHSVLSLKKINVKKQTFFFKRTQWKREERIADRQSRTATCHITIFFCIVDFEKYVVGKIL